MKRPGALIFDVLYGFIPITEWEGRIINSPFFQRLRWIKQLGFSNYIFPGAEHNRFAHVIGVMHSMDQMIRSIGFGVTEEELFDPKCRTPEAMLHKSLRIAALLHDIGTFPFSHAVEYAYIRHGNEAGTLRTSKKRNVTLPPKTLPNSHEHLGSFIIKNTRYDGGITQILEEFGFDVQMISHIIKGDSPILVANQLMHSDLDADRMDYLLRDAHYTGIKYGQFDRDYILANLTSYDAGEGQTAFGVRENAAHAVEDFLIARFSWYSQVIKNPGSAKFDIMCSHVAKGFLERGLLHTFTDLLTMIEERDERFFWWNDIYFMTRLQEARYKKLLKEPKLQDLTEMLLYRRAPKTIEHPLFKHRILKDDPTEVQKEELVRSIRKTAARFEQALEKYGTGREWILVDIPEKDVVFTHGVKHIIGKKNGSRPLRGGALYRERDPVKVIARDGTPKLLSERENSLMGHLSGFINFVPSVYGNDAAFRLLRKRGLLPPH
jgi:HD superfamily phosphohydrolase